MADGIDERTPLLAQDKETDDTTLLHEVRVLLQLTAPLVIISFLRTLVQTASVFCLGRLSTLYLSSASLGMLTVNVFGYAIVIGLTSSLDTLANQAIKSDSPKLASIYAMRAFVVCAMCMPFMYLILWNIRWLFSLILPRADPEMLRLAALYIKISSLGIPAHAAYECLRRYLASMKLLIGPTVAYALAGPMSIACTYWLTSKIGYAGAAISVVILYWGLFFITAVYARLSVPRHLRAQVSMTIFEDLGLNLKYGIAGVISTCSEWYAFEAMARLGATYLGEVPQAVNAIALNLNTLCYQIPFSLGQAVSISTGNSVGSGLPRRAKRAADAAQIVTLVAIGCNAILLQLFRSSFGHIFSKDPLVTSSFDKMAWLVALVVMFDGIQGVCSGALRGAGLPTTASRVNLFSYWVVGLPAGAYATYKLQAIEGLWIGLALAMVFAASLMSFRLWNCDWSERVKEAQERIKLSDEAAGLSNIEEVSDM